MLLLAFAATARSAPTPAATVIRNIATATYQAAGESMSETASSNPVFADVLPVEALALTQDLKISRPPGALVTLSHQLTNTGNLASRYALVLVNGGPGCPDGALGLGGLKIVRDANGNGVADPSDPAIASGAAGGVALEPGETASILLQGMVPASGTACIRLTATSAAQGASAANHDVIMVGDVAVIALTKTSSHSGFVMPGSAILRFTVSGTNIGARDAAPSATVAPAGTPLLVNGAPTALVLVRDVLPAGTHYVAGSLQSAAAGAQRLFRLPGDAPFSYRTVDDAAAIEVAIGLPAAVAPNASLAMRFAARVDFGVSGDIRNVAQAEYHDGQTIASSASNTVVIPLTPARIGVSKGAAVAVMNRNAAGAPDGTSTIRFSVRVRNYGTAWLYGVQASDAIEGSEANRFGTYTEAAVPGQGQYTIVARSIAASGIGNAAITANSGFTGAGNATGLFAPGGVLPTGAEATVSFDLRVNTIGRPGPFVNNVRAGGALAAGEAVVVFDDSVDGFDPDPDGNGDPGDNAGATPVATVLPTFAFAKSAALPRRIAQGIYEIDYRLTVTNTGSVPAPNVRLLDNLDCTFDMDRADGPIASWTLVAPPAMVNGLLRASPNFTGSAPCDRSDLASGSPMDLPEETALNLTDGVHALEPGQSEEARFTVRVTEKPAAMATRVMVTNKAWAAAFQEDAIRRGAPRLLTAAADDARSLLIDPQGLVYDAVSRLPIAGALVTATRENCTGTSGAITADQLFAGDSGAYAYNADGSVSMATGSDGSYQFFLQSPPVTGQCAYRLAVAPPAGSAYSVPSRLIPATPGTFSSCGAIVPNATAPQGSDPTTYYMALVAGLTPAGAACEALHNHIPLDPGNIGGLMLQKEGSKRDAELGDFVDYALTLTNRTGVAVTGFAFADVLPGGFGYVAGSARLDGAPAADPAGGAGPALAFAYPDKVLAAEESATVRYRLRIGVGARTSGDAVNRASASSGPLQSNEASWAVRMRGGVFSDEAYAFGTVALRCADGGPTGIPGVRLLLEDGTGIITDVAGKWSLYGLKPITHVLRLDQSTLPPGSGLEIVDSRNAGNPASRFLDLKKGEFVRADFAVTGCAIPEVLAEVKARRALIVKRGDAEGAAVVRQRLDPEGRPIDPGDTRALPAAGQVGPNGTTGSTIEQTRPLIDLPVVGATGSSFIGAGSGTLGGSGGGAFAPVEGVPGGGAPMPRAAPLLPVVAPTAIDLEKAMPDLDNAPGFIGLVDRDTVAAQSINVRVKGPAGSELRLSVNGVAIAGSRVGKKAVLASKKLAAWEYIGVSLKPGTNALKLEVIDPFGNARGGQDISVIAPDSLGEIAIDLPASARADQRMPIAVAIRLTDGKGVPVTARTQVTLEADRGRWIDDDLNPSEPGTQVFLEGGTAEFRLMPPADPGVARIRVSASNLVREARLTLLPELRPMIALGIVEGVLDFTKRGKLAIDQMPAGAAFETELTGLSAEIGDVRASGRTAFFLKGAIRGDTLLTASFDSAKKGRDQLFRDIRPDEFYPVYGDSATRNFDAQSSQKLYVRIDRNRSWLLYGDFITASSSEVRQLSQTSRTLTGIKNVYETDAVRATSYAARTSQVRRVEEIPAEGISGPYYLSAGAGELLANSERIEILVRDRNQPDLVLQTTGVTRFTDYTIEPLTRRLLFTRSIASLDANLNPQSIRITYEVDAGGPTYTVAGTDIQVKVAPGVQLGVVATVDEDPENRRKMVAATALARIGKASVAGEVVRTESDLNGTGTAGRVELRYQDKRLGAVAQAAKTSAGFDNPGATFSAGHTEAVARAEYKIDETMRLRAEAIYGEDQASEGSRAGVAASVQKKVGASTVAEIGLRYGQNSSATASMFDYTSVSTVNGQTGGGAGIGLGGGVGGGVGSQEDLATIRARVTTRLPFLPQAQVFVEGAQDLAQSGRHMAAIGGTYALTTKTRLYGRYELASTLGGPYDLSTSANRDVGIFGVESNYMTGGRAFSEYRLADSLDGRTGQQAIGLRNSFRIGKRWNLTAGIERIRVDGAGGGVAGQADSVAVVGGAEYLGERIKSSGVMEVRRGADADSVLSSFGLGYRLSDDWSLLARGVYTDSRGKGDREGDGRTLMRQQLGLAYRPATGAFNALARYEHRAEEARGDGSGAGSIDGGIFGDDTRLTGRSVADIFAANVNYTPHPGSAFTGRIGTKWAVDDDGILRSRNWLTLVQGRFIQDIGDRWDVGVQAGVLFGQDGATRITVGAEIGYRLMRDLWLSAGYNVVGLSDRDLAAADYTSRGFFARIRHKFGEEALGFNPVTVAPRPLPFPESEKVPEP